MWERPRGWFERMLRSGAPRVWVLVQATAAATIAWVGASVLAGRDDPFFAPIAALVALSQPLGERGLSALRLVLGVVIGIVVGELTVGLLGESYGDLAVATFIAMAVATSLSGIPLVVIQSGTAAVLTVATADGETGPDRLINALIGTGVALVFTQFLFPPEPVRLIRRAEAAALRRMAVGTRMISEALRTGDEPTATRALDTLRDLCDDLAELRRVHRASGRVVRHSVRWRSRTASVVRERENAGLDLLGSSCMLLARTAAGTAPSERHRAVRSISAVASVLADLAADPRSRDARHAAVERALEIRRDLAIDGTRGPQLAVVLSLQMVTGDLMVFAAADSGEAAPDGRTGP